MATIKPNDRDTDVRAEEAEETLPLPLDAAVTLGQTTELQRAALEQRARANRRSLAAEIRDSVNPPEA